MDRPRFIGRLQSGLACRSICIWHTHTELECLSKLVMFKEPIQFVWTILINWFCVQTYSHASDCLTSCEIKKMTCFFFIPNLPTIFITEFTWKKKNSPCLQTILTFRYYNYYHSLEYILNYLPHHYRVIQI